MKKLLTIVLVLSALALDAQPNYQWAKAMGGTAGDIGSSIAVDASGNVYTTGSFQGTADFDPAPGTANLTSAGGFDIFISKLDASGNFVWSKSMGGASDDYGSGIAVDAFGNVYTTGSFKGTVDFDPGAETTNLTAAGSSDIFISKFDASGNFVWAKSMGGASDDYGSGIATDASGNVYTTGSFTATVDFDPGAGTTNLIAAGSSDIFVSKFDASGNFVWTKAMGGASDDYGLAIAVDASGNVYTTGNFAGTADFDPGAETTNLTAAGGNDVFSDIFISKFDASGNFIWAKAMGGTDVDSGLAIAVDASGNVYTTGDFIGTADFDPGTGTANLTSAAASDDIFVSKLDASGNFVWAKAMGGTSGDAGRSIAVDASGNVYTTGDFQGTADFDPGTGTANLTSAGSVDIFISKLDASGNFLWATAIGGTSLNGGYAIAVDASRNIYTTGNFQMTGDFDPGQETAYLTSAGGNDIFVSKLSQSSPLPVSLANFSAYKNNSSIQLAWQTFSEQNTVSFVVERSADGSKFSSIGTVAAAGNSSSAKNYAYTDVQPLAGTNFYRLKTIDTDGKFSYSKVVAENMGADAKTVYVFPNPAKDVLFIQAAGDEAAIANITDVAGKIVKQQKIQLNGSTSFSLNVHDLPAGQYYFILQTKENKRVQQFVKQ